MTSREKVDLYCSGNQFYKRLSDAGREKFAKRLEIFRPSFKFVPRQGIEMLEEIEYFICAAAVQVTFGLKYYKLPLFHTVHVYPESYYSKLLDSNLKGGTDPKGILYFSWYDFKEGFEKSDNRINLGLHEFAHALMINLIKGTRFDPDFASYFDRWFEIASEIFTKLQNGECKSLRAYGSKNKYEFFAVFTEHFFEHPESCRIEFPDAYNHCCVLFNLNPLNHNRDFALEAAFIKEVNSNASLIPLPLKIKRTYQYHGWHWSSSMMAGGLLGGTGLIAYFLPATILPTNSFIQIIFSFILIGFLQWPYFKARKILSMYFFIFYCIAGNGILGGGLLLSINYLTAGEISTERYEIDKIEIKQRKIEESNTVFLSTLHLKSSQYSELPKVRTFTLGPSEIRKEVPGYFELDVGKGLFGIPVICDRRVVYDQ